VKLGTLTLSEAATLAGRAIGPAIATAANRIVAMVVSCMVKGDLMSSLSGVLN
jgi:hypothetical protein